MCTLWRSLYTSIDKLQNFCHDVFVHIDYLYVVVHKWCCDEHFMLTEIKNGYSLSVNEENISAHFVQLCNCVIIILNANVSAQKWLLQYMVTYCERAAKMWQEWRSMCILQMLYVTGSTSAPIATVSNLRTSDICSEPSQHSFWSPSSKL